MQGGLVCREGASSQVALFLRAWPELCLHVALNRGTFSEVQTIVQTAKISTQPLCLLSCSLSALVHMSAPCLGQCMPVVLQFYNEIQLADQF